MGVAYGFVGNRILAARSEEADKMVMEGVQPWDIDKVLVQFGFPMGGFSMWDLAGLDLGWVKEESHGETLRDLLNEAGRKGQKTGGGYYDYDAARKATPSLRHGKAADRFSCGPRKASGHAKFPTRKYWSASLIP